MMVFFDIETGLEGDKVYDYGAVREDGAILHTSSRQEFLSFIEKCDTLCGHNIIRHDLNYLNFSKQFNIIDTLPVSPLLFPKKPYHRLLKDEKLQVDELNNPVNDSIKAKDLFCDELEAWKQLNKNIQEIYYKLLSGNKDFSGFLKYVHKAEFSNKSISQLVDEEYKGLICDNANIEAVARQYPVELAYALALIGTDDYMSMTPSWVMYSYPKVGNVMNFLRNTPCGKCQYCKSRLDAHEGLKEYFGYDEFRTFDGVKMQQQAVEAAIKGESILTIFPTGGGKSLTFQLPALMAGRNIHGLTVVISPLQSLMKDQVDNLADRGIYDAVTINGLLDPVERAVAIQQVADGAANILYIAPEMLRNRTVEKLLLSRNVVRFVIDEAHCFSAWGQDFRTDYFYIGDFIKKIQEKKHQKMPIAVSCFTATAKQKVVSDICDYFNKKLGVELKVFAASSERKNLRYSVLHTETEDEKYAQLRNLIIGHNCPTIVYVSRTRRTMALAARLAKDGIKALPFNGKMEAADKVNNQNAFMSGEVKVIVATSAFGMGVDKKDVGLVVHYDISDSLENYVQEAGRAGRDPNMEADCFVLFNDNDLDKHFILLNQTKLSISEIQQVWKAIKDLTIKFNQVSCSPLEIARQAGWEDDGDSMLETRVKGAITALEDAGFIHRGNNSPRIFATAIKVKSVDEARNKLMSSKFFDEKTREQAVRIIRSLISSKYTAKGRGAEAESRVDYLADILGMQKDSVMRNINLMRQEGILADAHDMTAYIDKANLVKELDKIMMIERFLIERYDENSTTIYYKIINDQAQKEGIKHSTVKKLRNLLHFHLTKGYIARKETRFTRECMKLNLMADKDKIIERFEKRIELCRFVAKRLSNMAETGDNKKMIAFSMVELLEQFIATQQTLQFDDKGECNLGDMEEALLYLSRMGLLNIEGGFMVVYNTMKLKRLVERKIKYNKEQYRLFDEFYQQRIQQIHIVGEYANMMVSNYDAAVKFVNDYFLMDYKAFIAKYFEGERKAQITKNITPALYKQIFGSLSSRQREIIDDKQSKYVVVAAGPGSGKTRVLVHKLASLLLMEDVKHEQLLMLTFSRAAATEFKKRLIDLVGTAAHFVDIKTFHSYSFDLMGKQGNLEDAKNIVRSAAEMIENGEVEESKIAKSVLVIDEAQDMSVDDFRLVRALITRNEDMRLIAVGDDDQNIYSFRGSNSIYLKSIVNNYGAKLYELVENFRSDKSIVDYSNNYVQKISNRMKQNPIVAVSKKNGIVNENTQYQNSIFCSNQAEGQVTGDSKKRCSTAVLTITNEQTLQVAHILRLKGLNVRLVQATEGFRFINMAEVRFFFKKLGKMEDGSISVEKWNQAKRLTQEYYATSKCLRVINQFFADFEATHKSFYYSDVREFALESSVEDFIESDDKTVFVSTIHKAKGREFDNVHLLVGGVKSMDQDMIRAIYVGITRTKHQLFIYDDLSFLDSQHSILIAMSMHDVWLHFFKDHKNRVLSLRSGDKMKCANDYLLSEKGEMIAHFSNSMSERIKEYEKNGYKISDAEVSFVIAWRPQEEKEEIAVCLANLILSKQ